MLRAALLGLCLVAGPLGAAEEVASDLDGDGRAERFALRDTGEGTVDLLIDGAVVAPDIAWKGGIGQEPALALAPNGSVRLSSMNESIGRYRWHLTLTIAWRDGAYRVAGLTYEWYDTLDLDRAGFCDLNLLNGRGFARTGQGAQEAVRTSLRAPRVDQWHEGRVLPEVCPTG